MKDHPHVIVTGGAGFIGSHLASRLISEGYKVTVLDNLSTGKERNVPREANLIKMDLGLEDSYRLLKDADCDAICHLGGQSSGEASFLDPLYDLRSHVMSTFLLLEWCRKKGVRRFLYASSMSVYGDPDHLPVTEEHPYKPKTFYASAKMAAEAYIKLYQTLGIDTTILRLFSVYGPGQNLENKMQGMVSIYLSYMLNGVPIPVKGSGDRFRDLVYIDDVVDAWREALDNPASYGRVYNIASGAKTKVGDILKMLTASFGMDSYPIAYKGNTPGDQFGIVADISRVKKDLKWKPKTDIRDGIDNMVKFEKNRRENGRIDIVSAVRKK